tara:strand:+ start:446 stop:1582 length:1137 start_codon:yes stop_codon:yes gene_type:complete
MSNNPPVGIEVPKVIHPFAKYLDAYTDLAEAPEFVVDDVVSVGAVVFAGERGMGKTSTLVPMAVAATGLINDYPLIASIRRKVVYVTEDVAQVRRIISSMRTAGMITASRDSFNEWFKIVEAKRMKAVDIVAVVPAYEDLYTANKKVDGGTYMAPPVLVLDTTNATVDLDNISDNAEVSQAVALLRQSLGAICLWLIGHVTKASKNDAKQVTFIGAGSWEGDTQQAIYLVFDEGERYMLIGKKRFEPIVTEYRIKSYVNRFDAIDKLGRTVEIKCFYGVPEATSKEIKDETKAQQQAEQKAASWTAAQSRVLKYIGAHPGTSGRNVKKEVGGNEKILGQVLDELEQTEEIHSLPGERKGWLKYYIGKNANSETLGDIQ